MPIVIAAESTKDWRKLLQDPEKQWRQGYSAKSLADSWQNEDGFPADVRQLFESASVPGINDAEMLLGIPEHTTALPGGGFPSYTDLFVLAKCRDGLISMAVEGKERLDLDAADDQLEVRASAQPAMVPDRQEAGG